MIRLRILKKTTNEFSISIIVLNYNVWFSIEGFQPSLDIIYKVYMINLFANICPNISFKIENKILLSWTSLVVKS